MISRPTWLAFLEPSRWRSTNPFLRMPDYQVTSKLSFPIFAQTVDLYACPIV